MLRIVRFPEEEIPTKHNMYAPSSWNPDPKAPKRAFFDQKQGSIGQKYGKNWSWREESNPRPADYKSAALPTELRQPDPKLQQHGEILLKLSNRPPRRAVIVGKVLGECNRTLPQHCQIYTFKIARTKKGLFRAPSSTSRINPGCVFSPA